MRPPNNTGSLTEDNVGSLCPKEELTKAAVDCLLDLVIPSNEDSHTSRSEFHIWPGIYIHDSAGTDDTATWSPQGDVTAFNSSRYQLYRTLRTIIGSWQCLIWKII